MKTKISLHQDYDVKWLGVINDNLDSFIQDHADCERRSSTMALSIIAKYPEKHKINNELISLSIQKLQRFQELYLFMYSRQIALPKEMSFDLYGKQLGWLIKSGKEERLMDRLLIAGIIEEREQQRICLAQENLQDSTVKDFYGQFLHSNNVYLDLGLEFFPREQVISRWDELCEKEAEIFLNLDLRPTLH